MDILKIIKIIGVILQLIASGLSESEAISDASAKFGIPESFIRMFM